MTPRNRWIALTLIALVVANIAWYVYSRWGLITVQVDDKPLAQVVRSIEKQGGITIRTDIPGDTLVSMHVHLVTLREALETLSTVTDSRWQLAYVFGPEKGTVAALLGTVVTGERPEGWKTAFYPIRGLSVAAEANLPADPRKDFWNVKDPGQKTAQAVLDQGARSVSATFVFPENWDPAVASLPSSGVVSSVAHKVAKLTGGAEEEVVLLLRGKQGGDVADFGDDGDRYRGGRNWLSGGRRGNGPGGPGFDAMAERVRAEVEKLPPQARTVALAELDERKKFFDGLRDLSPEDRRAKIEEFMSQQSVQDQMDQNKLARESRMTPAQKQARAQKYEQRREQYLASGSTGGGGGGGGGRGGAKR